MAAKKQSRRIGIGLILAIVGGLVSLGGVAVSLLDRIDAKASASDVKELDVRVQADERAHAVTDTKVEGLTKAVESLTGDVKQMDRKLDRLGSVLDDMNDEHRRQR